jgi:nitroreductase
MTDITEARRADYDIDLIYLKRWSPRSFLDKVIPDDILYSLFEAARWAPSAANVQPWRFIVAKKEEDRERFLAFINEGNTTWCSNAPVFVAVVSKVAEERFGGKNPSHAFDVGAAWGFFALEAARKGLITHAMGGFNKNLAREALNVPNDYEIHAIIAVGYQGSKDSLNEAHKNREKPSGRRPVEDFTFEGVFLGE